MIKTIDLSKHAHVTKLTFTQYAVLVSMLRVCVVYYGALCVVYNMRFVNFCVQVRLDVCVCWLFSLKFAEAIQRKIYTWYFCFVLVERV